jgi:hypothetical protein
MTHMGPISIPTRHGGLWSRLRPLALAGGRANGLLANLAYGVGGGLVAVTGVIHLHLWMNGYRQIPTIGPLFLAQAIGGFAVALTILLTRRLWSAVLGLGLAASTIGGFVLAVTVGIFNFQDSWSAPDATLAFVVELAAVVVLATAGVLSLAAAKTRA